MPFFYKLKLQYQGSNYLGWQIQTKTYDRSTIQGELNKALKTLCNSDVIRTTGSSRTDAGVHALGLIVKAEIPLALPDKALILGLNSYLPLDIRVLESEECSRDFHPTLNAKSKEYLYIFSNEKKINAFQNNFMANYKHELDFDLMRQACKRFIGEHDFVNFFVKGTEVKTNVRTIFECELLDSNCSDFFGTVFPKHYILRFRGSGFLKQQVRLMVGAIWNVARKKRQLSDLEMALQRPLSRKIGAVAPPNGLYLKEVFYN